MSIQIESGAMLCPCACAVLLRKIILYTQGQEVLEKKRNIRTLFQKKERKRNLHKLHDDIYHNIVWFQPATVAIPFHDVLAQHAWHVGDW